MLHFVLGAVVGILSLLILAGACVISYGVGYLRGHNEAVASLEAATADAVGGGISQDEDEDDEEQSDGPPPVIGFQPEQADGK